MRLPLRFDSEKTMILLGANFHAQDKLMNIDFLIDTGSSNTTISFWHTKLMGIDLSDLEEHARPSLTYAGHVRPLRLRNVGFLFIEEKGRFVFERLRSIDLLPSTGSRQLDVFLPSVIGMDFLNECSYSLHVCPMKNKAFLEKSSIPRF